MHIFFGGGIFPGIHPLFRHFKKNLHRPVAAEVAEVKLSPKISGCEVGFRWVVVGG